MDEIQMIRDAFDGMRSPSAEATARARAALLEHARAAPVGRPVPGGRKPAVRRWGWSLAGLGLSGAVAAGVAVAVLVATPPATPGGTPPSPGGVAVSDAADAGVVLRLAAANAQLEPPVKIRQGQYVYLRTDWEELSRIGDVKGGGPAANIMVQNRHEIWYDPQNIMTPVRTRRSDGLSRTPLTPADAAIVKQLQYDLAAAPEIQEHGPTPAYVRPADCKSCPIARDPGALFRPTPNYLASLPTDATQLLDTLRKAVGNQNKHSPDAQLFTAILDLFRQADPIIPPSVRAALYQVLGMIPGVVRVEGQVDLAGQRGIAVGRPSEVWEGDSDRPEPGPEREELVFDSVGRKLIGFRTVMVRADRGLAAGTVTSRSIPKYAIVDEIGQTK